MRSPGEADLLCIRHWNDAVSIRMTPIPHPVRPPFFLFALTLVAANLVLADQAQAALLSVEGHARDPKSDRLLYREEHLFRREGERPVERLVLYRCPDGVAFARKRIDYRSSATAPEFELVDARGYREGLRREGGQTMIWSGSKPPRPLRKSDGPLVADAGFDEFLRQSWSQLGAGKSQALAFVVPAFGRSLAFEVRGLGRRGSGDAAVQRFELRLEGLLGKVTSPISVEYTITDRRLRRFAGLTNVRDGRGDQIEARIDFPDAPQPAEAQRWQTAAAVPLASCKLGR